MYLSNGEIFDVPRPRDIAFQQSGNLCMVIRDDEGRELITRWFSPSLWSEVKVFHDPTD